jgi:hypothetical protein
MAIIDFVFLCDYAFMDGSGKTSIIGTFDNINAAEMPLTWMQMFVAIKFTASQTESLNIKVLLSAPSGKEVYRVEANARPGATPPDSQNNPQNTVAGFLPLPMYNVNFTELGEHHIEIFFDNNPIHSIPLMVRKK